MQRDICQNARRRRRSIQLKRGTIKRKPVFQRTAEDA